MRRFLTAAVIVGLAVPVPAQAREPVRLKPSSKWLLNYAEESCRLARKFGEGDQQVTLFFDQLEPGDWFQIVLSGKALRSVTRDAPRSNLSFRFGPNEAADDLEASTGTLGELPAALLSGSHRIAPLTAEEKKEREAAQKLGENFDPPPLGAEREKAATYLEVTKGSMDLILETGPMNAPLTALRECAWDTIRSWGLDVEQQKTLSRKVARINPTKPWMFSRDYPMEMQRGGYEGVVNFRLLVDASGTPSSCTIQTSTRPKEFDDAVCKAVMKRVRFNPALDANGKPVPSYFRQTVSFRLEP